MTLEDKFYEIVNQNKIGCVEVDTNLISGVNLNEPNPRRIINGLRHPITATNTGWFIWVGEHFGEEVGFFTPSHTHHIIEKIPELEKILTLPPGWRFLIAPDYVDIWFDETLFHI